MLIPNTYTACFSDKRGTTPKSIVRCSKISLLEIKTSVIVPNSIYRTRSYMKLDSKKIKRQAEDMKSKVKWLKPGHMGENPGFM